jgi:hypothetical protein
MKLWYPSKPPSMQLVVPSSVTVVMGVAPSPTGK